MTIDGETATAPETVRPSSPRSFRLGPLYATVPLANLVVYAVWTVVPGFLLPVTVQHLTGSTDVTSLGIASTLGTIAATLGNPVFGQLSDRTRSRFGRRTPWMVACALAGAIMLLLQSAASSITMLGITYAGTSLIINGFQAAMTAVVPDRFPSAKLNVASALMGVGLNAGVLTGSLLFTFFPGFAGPSGYYLMAGLIAVTAFVFAVASPDADSRDLPREPFRLGQFLRNFWISPRKHPDFAWVFLARVLLMLGYFMLFSFFFFALQDWVGLSPEQAVTAGGTLFAVNGAASVVGGLVTVPLAHRYGRLKIFVTASGIGLALSLLIPLLMPSYSGMVIYALVGGLAFGVYMAVDTALINKVLPHAEDAAKDLGIMNMASAFPQVLAASLGAVLVNTVGYGGLFAASALIAAAGALAVLPVRKIR
ncbi:MFS transporter [Streptomyces dysideae]|uniref:Major facilitator superfamily (MFS) profile domain-containing protein n=1 Tax=Streptomyces dysideae TaxID=909626 RepID=A0A101UWC6_9ACTN|nr:MFS transporter [Streptomyces dysideae]KUO18076.1 hypothetical protein AQJ91_27150 [Streptomyces dysideae]